MLLFDSIASDLLPGRPLRAALFICLCGTFFLPCSRAFLRRRRCIFYRKPGYFHSKTGAFLLIWRLKSRLFRVSTNSVQYDSYWFSSTFCLLSPLPHTCSKKKVLYWEKCMKTSNGKVHNHLYNIFFFYYILFSKDLYKNQKKIVLSYFRKLIYLLSTILHSTKSVRNQHEQVRK